MKVLKRSLSPRLETEGEMGNKRLEIKKYGFFFVFMSVLTTYDVGHLIEFQLHFVPKLEIKEFLK